MLNVLDCLQTRYNAGLTYTHAGKNILVSLNPCQILGCLQFQDSSHHFVEKINTTALEIAAEKCFSEAFQSFYEETGKLKNQAFLIIGESGSGKTENLKLLLKYFTEKRNIDNEKNENEHLFAKACASNPILESFGNAATCRNLNSSRFAKYVDLAYNEYRSLISMNIRVILLEKTRVLFLKDSSSNESFHVFYQMQSAFNEGYFKHFPILSELYCPFISVSRKTGQYEASWSNLTSALNTFGFFVRHTELELISLLASLQLLCQLEFHQGLSDADKCEIVLTQSDKLNAIEQLLGLSSELDSLSPSELQSSLLQSRFNAGCGGGQARRDTCYVRNCSPSECSNRRDSLVKTIYQSLFNYLVDVINEKSAISQNASVKIGLLDIFGYEVLQCNQFEQLCINYTNERLQQNFLHHFIEELAEDYRMESVHTETIFDRVIGSSPLLENAQIINLMTGPAGVFQILNEECLLNRNKATIAVCKNGCSPADANFLHRLEQDCHNQHLSVDSSKGEFLIRHFCYPVNYSAKQFVEKNIDRLPQDLEDFIVHCLYRDSTNSILTCLTLPSLDSVLKSKSKLADSPSVSREPLKDTANYVTSLRNTFPLSIHGRTKKKNTVASWLKSSVDELLSELFSYQVTYVRCIRPSDCENVLFSRRYVEAQLTSSGLYEAIDVMKTLHPARFRYIDFIRRYGFLINLCGNIETISNDQLYLALDKRFRKLYGLTDTPTKATVKSLRRKSGGSCNEHSFHLTATIVTYCCHPWIVSLDNDLPHLTRLGKSRIYLNDQEYTRLEKLRRVFLNSKCRCIQRYWNRYRNCKRELAASTIQKFYRTYKLRIKQIDSISTVKLIEYSNNLNELNADSDLCVRQTDSYDSSFTSSSWRTFDPLTMSKFLIYPDVISIRRRPTTKVHHWRKANPLDYLVCRTNSLFKHSSGLKGLLDCFD